MRDLIIIFVNWEIEKEQKTTSKRKTYKVEEFRI